MTPSLPSGSPGIDDPQSPPLRAFRVGWTLFVVLLTSVPYVVNFLTAPPGTHYTWVVPPYAEDSLAYRSWSQQAAHGSLLFRLKYTALPHAAFLFQPLFLVAGWLSDLCGCDVGIVHLIVKSVGVALFFAAFYRYTDLLRLSRRQSMFASVLVGVSSGLGGFFAFLDPTGQSWTRSADLWVVDCNTFWSLLWNPLFPFSLTLMLLAIAWLDRGTREGRRPDLWRSGFATGAQILVHPYAQPLLFSLAVVLTVRRRRTEAAGDLWRYGLAALPGALYVDAIALLDPIVSRHSAHGAMPSPALQAGLLGFGLPLLLAIAGLVAARRLPGPDIEGVILWFVLSFGLSYVPFWFQRKLLFGAHVPLCILAGMAPEAILARLPWARTRPWVPKAALALFLPLVVVTPVYLLMATWNEARLDKNGAYFVSDDVRDALRFLEEHSDPMSVVFASPSTSRLIPAFAGNTVVWGHWAQSVDRLERERWFADLFRAGSDWNDVTRSQRFWGTGIDYLFVDPPLRSSMQQHEAAWRLILADADQVFANTSIVIYRHRT